MPVRGSAGMEIVLLFIEQSVLSPSWTFVCLFSRGLGFSGIFNVGGGALLVWSPLVSLVVKASYPLNESTLPTCQDFFLPPPSLVPVGFWFVCLCRGWGYYYYFHYYYYSYYHAHT